MNTNFGWVGRDSGRLPHRLTGRHGMALLSKITRQNFIGEQQIRFCNCDGFR